MKVTLKSVCCWIVALFCVAGTLWAQEPAAPPPDQTAANSSEAVGPPAPELQTFPVLAAMDLLDPQETKGNKTAILKTVQHSADQGNPISQYVMGSLYRLGMDHPAHVLDKDLDKAETYLSNAAIQGQIGALAGMALIKLERHQSDDAQVWAWAYAQFVAIQHKRFGGDKRVGQYGVKLFLKCKEQVGEARADSSEMQAYKRAFIDQYGSRILSALGNSARMYWGAPPKLLSSELSSPSGISARYPALAEFLVEIRPDGSVARAVVIDSLSNERIGSRWLSQVRSRVTFNALAEDAPQLPRISFFYAELEWEE